MAAPFRIGSYPWAGGCEAMLRFGPDDGVLAIAALPLFEEANRTRAFAVAILRALAARGIGGVLPDLPGTGESMVRTQDARLSAMRDAYGALAGEFAAQRRVYAVGLRSGALLDGLAPVAARWHLAPQSGADLLRELWRVRRASSGDRTTLAADAAIWPGNGPVDVAGNRMSRAMIGDLTDAAPADTGRIVRLEADPRPADLKLPGVPLWRRAEPGNDLDLADRLAGDIAGWIVACEG